MPSLFDSETDAPEERKVLKRTLGAQKITFILTALSSNNFTASFGLC